MKHRRRIILILVSLLVLAGLIFWFTHSNEPTYQGKTLTYWLTEYNDARLQADAAEIANSTNAIKAIGTNGIPALLKLLQARDIKGSQQIESFVQRLGWTTFQITHARQKWDLADQGFFFLGKDAGSAAPMLADLLKKSPPEPALNILSSFANVHPPKEIALPVLTQQLTNTNGDLRWCGANYFKDLYPDEAEKAGVYTLFPKLRPRSTNAPAINK
jgi:hypothetical protein